MGEHGAKKRSCATENLERGGGEKGSHPNFPAHAHFQSSRVGEAHGNAEADESAAALARERSPSLAPEDDSAAYGEENDVVSADAFTGKLSDRFRRVNDITVSYNKNRRGSVSAESIRPSEDAPDRVVIPKDNATKMRIATATGHNLLFRNLDPEQRHDIVRFGRRKPRRPAKPGPLFEKLNGSRLPAVHWLSSFPFLAGINDDDDDTPTRWTPCSSGGRGHHQAGRRRRQLLRHRPGEFRRVREEGQRGKESHHDHAGRKFRRAGADTPRAATVIAAEDGVLWAVDRATFRHSLTNHSFRKRKMYEDFLASVPLLSSLERAEFSKIADALEPVEYEDGDVIIEQGAPGDYFYVIESGECKVTKTDEHGTEREFPSLGPGSYFGELALINDKPRAATVSAKGPVKVVALSRDAFVRLLGPVMDPMKRKTADYTNLMTRTDTESNHE
ncbi:MAG: hypothetical protein BJ554DRAFT_677 [Olpidium bornovanus]|uniref:cAMP-dependent protein kinase regulatory subunit n=1 Tax=Olpidium bornovanus TaxID=278681 RepID=A0A8H7ZSX0_9FUNG|nr:MAG: hypothetical protein BJ554DRAFT_677 [Olpidium bornovanus]